MSARDYSSLCDISPHTDRPLNDQGEIFTPSIQLTTNSCFHSSDSSGSCDNNDQNTFFTRTFFTKLINFYKTKSKQSQKKVSQKYLKTQNCDETKN